jgi:hypothetical protein
MGLEVGNRRGDVGNCGAPNQQLVDEGRLLLRLVLDKLLLASLTDLQKSFASHVLQERAPFIAHQRLGFSLPEYQEIRSQFIPTAAVSS